MSGRILIQNEDGSDFVTSGLTVPTELELYSPVVQDSFDADCGTTGVVNYRSDGGSMACAESFVPGSIDSPFDICLQVARGHLYLYLS